MEIRWLLTRQCLVSNSIDLKDDTISDRKSTLRHGTVRARVKKKCIIKDDLFNRLL